MHIKNLVFLFLLCPALLLAVIIETPHFSEIEKHFEKGHPEKMILLCDLDNTLFKADHHLGSIAWCDHVKAELIAKGMSKKEAQEIEDIYLKTIRPYIKIRSVDPQSPSILENLQKKGVLVLGLTARSPHDADFTIHQLQSLGIKLGQSNTDFTFESLNKEPVKPLYKHGILFGTTFHKKSNILFHFLAENKIHPDSIVFVDDLLHHVEDLSYACKEKNISFIGVRFSGADEEAKLFREWIAAIPWKPYPASQSAI